MNGAENIEQNEANLPSGHTEILETNSTVLVTMAFVTDDSRYAFAVERSPDLGGPAQRPLIRCGAIVHLRRLLVLNFTILYRADSWQLRADS